MKRTFVEVSEMDVITCKGGDRLFFEAAGICAVPIKPDGLLWIRHDWRDTYVAACLIPSPEGLLLP